MGTKYCHDFSNQQTIGIIMLAIFIAGPFRYLNYLLRQLDNILAESDIGYSYFIHVWESDKGNKIREESNVSFDEIIHNSRVKYLVVQHPYSIKDIEDYGFHASRRTDDDGNQASSINASYGMFYSMRVLLNSMKCMIDKDKFTHILRLRTDTLILNPSFINDLYFKAEGITVPHNHLLGNDYLRLCDHIWFSRVREFEKVWDSDFKSIYRIYTKTGRSPETALGILKKIKLPITPVYNDILRDIDYHIVYNPCRSYDPQWRRKCTDIKKLYANYIQHYNDPETETIRDQHNRVRITNMSRTLRSKVSVVVHRFLNSE